MTLPNLKSDLSALGNVSALARPSSDIQHFLTVLIVPIHPGQFLRNIFCQQEVTQGLTAAQVTGPCSASHMLELIPLQFSNQ